MKSTKFILPSLTVLACSACTEQLPGSFRLAQQDETFDNHQDFNTKIDLLWVVDNSASMDASQLKLRQGFASFARTYMQPTWDIRVAVITTDTYMAHTAFQTYLGTTIPSTTGWVSPHIAAGLASWVNPTWNSTLVNPITGAFDSGVKYGELIPVWGPSFGRLLSGYHDGPITALCSELMPYFINGVTQCAIRDDRTQGIGASKCLSPNSGAGQSSISQCVNTVQNNTIHSGRAIISTMPPSGTLGDENWTNSLINDFTLNVSTGSAGQGSERGLGSVLQLLSSNESSDTAFFRKNSLRGIIFVSDEEDQTMSIPTVIPGDFKPQSYYKCDQASLVALNGAAPITGLNGYCCSDPLMNCTYGSEGTSCPSKNIEGHTYTVSVCPREDKLIAVSDVKAQLDTFFKGLDGAGAAPNYFVTSIVALNASAIQGLQSARSTSDTAVGAIQTIAVDRGDRYMELGRLVGNGSMAMNIAASDYSPILDAIGQAILTQKGSFTLERAPTSQEDMILKIIHADKTETIIDTDKYSINDKTLTITNASVILRLKASDSIAINYQPKTVF